jgi:hypothetical protein
MDVYDLLNRDERLEMKLQALSKSTIVPKEYYEPMKFPKNQSVAPLYPSPEDLDMRDLGIEAQLQKISRNSIKEVAGWKPTKIMSAVTEEMIKDYQDELHNTHYEDPITGKKFRYVPAGADIDLEEPYLVAAFDNDQLQAIQNAKKEPAQKIVDLNEMLQSLYKRRQTLMDTEYTKPSPFDKPMVQRARIRLIQAREDELAYLVIAEQEIKDEILDAEYEYEKFNDMIKVNDKILSDNQAEQSRTDKINRGVLQAKSDELMTLNRGKMNVTQGVNEPAEDYKQRLLDIGAETYDLATITDSARLRNVDRFKTSMKELFRDTVLIDSLVKEIMSKNDDSIFNYNKFMIPLKKNFLEVYGYANKDLKTESIPDIIDFFDNAIDKASLKKTVVPAVLPVPRREPRAEPAEDPLTAMLSRRRPPPPEEPTVPWAGRATKVVVAEPVRAEPVRRGGLTMAEMLSAAKPLKSSKARPSSVVLAKPSAADEMKAKLASRRAAVAEPEESWDISPLELSADDLRQEYGGKYLLATGKPLRSNGTAPYLLSQLNDAKLLDLADELSKQQAKSPQKKITDMFSLGSGISDRKLPKRIKFGKIALNPHRLYYDNMLVVLRQDGGHLLGYKNIPVSDAFVNVLMKIMDTEPVHHQDFKMFSINERELYDNLIHLAGLHKKVENNIDSTRKGMKQRLELIEGEIGAGNTNVNLKHEVKQLLHKMAYGGMISHPQARAHLKQLTSHF